MGIGPVIYRFFTRFMGVDEKRTDLRDLLQELDSRVRDMDGQLMVEELKPGKKRKKVMEVYLKQVKRYKSEAKETLEKSEGGQWKLKRMLWVPGIERYLREGQELLYKADKFHEEGLTNEEVCTRGDKLLAGELMGETANQLLDTGFEAIKRGARFIGIYGPVGVGKTHLMKHLYNRVYDDKQRFKAVFWASAPKQPCNKTLQECVAEAMWFKLRDDDEVRRASLLARRLNDLGPGHIIIFMDDVREEFLAYELLGIPCPATTLSSITTTLVFTAPSKDICNRMRCDLQLKMNLLPEHEAIDLFLHEAGRNNNNNNNNNNHIAMMIQTVAKRVAKQCAGMPLAIILIARSMARVEDLHEWRNRLQELMGTIDQLHNEEDKIVEHLKFTYTCINDITVKRCFLASSRLLIDDHDIVVTKDGLVQSWIDKGIISCCRHGNDHGFTIVNVLERMCLLEVVEFDGVRMNKWVRKMAETMHGGDKWVRAGN